VTGLVPGLCSISFRALGADEVLALAEKGGLEAIEWGADVHAPPADLRTLRELAARCGDAGISCPSYGTYFFAGRTPTQEIGPLLDGALALGARTVRVWAAMGVVPGAPDEEREPVVDALREVAAAAERRDLDTGIEFHPGTLTQTAASTLELLRDAGSPRLLSYWQPEAGAVPERSLAELDAVLPSLAHLHVFSWDPDPQSRRPLDHLDVMWRAALRRAAGATTGTVPRCAYLEYLPDDDPAALVRDAGVLRRWIAEETT
jgi:sugar phosphate isomerase/epimerase